MKVVDVGVVFCAVVFIVCTIFSTYMNIRTIYDHHDRINWLAAHPEHGSRILQAKDNDAVDRYIDAQIAKEKP